jgi:hypothetical protein
VLCDRKSGWILFLCCFSKIFEALKPLVLPVSFQLERKPDSRKQKKGEPAGIMNIFWKLTAADRPFFRVGPFYQE